MTDGARPPRLAIGLRESEGPLAPLSHTVFSLTVAPGEQVDCNGHDSSRGAVLKHEGFRG